ncbi:MAG: NADH-quinone oxidoreductase subunit L [Planctomycetaceae bacterium]|nr:NADH-quinone oxidoreductase subunit L [Planctomycetaceae bacterium]
MSQEQYIYTGTILKWLLGIAWLLPLAGFAIEIFGGAWGKRLDPESGGRKVKLAAYLAVFCIGTGFLLSLAAFAIWKGNTGAVLLAPSSDAHHDVHEHGEADPPADHAHPHPHGAEADHDHPHSHPHPAPGEARGQSPDADAHAEHVNNPYAAAFSGTYYELARFGKLRLAVDYYIDGLTVLMFCMVTLIATCIHIFAIGYMGDELTEDYEDHQVHLSGGRHFHRPGRFYRFFAFLSLFCFSMLGLVIAGNIFQVFVFWELVGVCSYLLIGFYVERHSASTAANKAFIMNRVGDFGFLIGLMILLTYFGTFQFANVSPPQAAGGDLGPGLFQMVRDAHGAIHVEDTADGRMVMFQQGAAATTGTPAGGIPYWLLVAAGIGIFAGCVGKSAQFPLQPWLPDAMEGPTPVSALVHSATMVAAGVYLAGRFYPMFLPEVLLVIAYVGCITLFIGATIAIVATDIKRVLAYSTISQLGYMMLALGVGGWVAGLYHLVTHAFFKSLMFLSSGSVIYGCHHEQEMTKMGGLYKKMPITCAAMLVGVVAISGLAIWIPVVGLVGLSGFYSKDSVIASALAFMAANPNHFLLFLVPLTTAGLTAFYMFRLWFMTFAGPPRDHHVHEHAHESPRVMTVPLIILSVFAIGCAWFGVLENWILTAEPAHVAAGVTSSYHVLLTMPGHHAIHAMHHTAGLAALIAAVTGLLLSAVFYWKGLVDPEAVRRPLGGVHRFLVDKWQFDYLYDVMFVRPVHIVAFWCTAFDKKVLDGFLHWLSRATVMTSNWDRKFDETMVDGLVNLVGNATYSVGRSLRTVQTGRLRQYVMFIAVGVLGLFVLMFMFFPRT